MTMMVMAMMMSCKTSDFIFWKNVLILMTLIPFPFYSGISDGKQKSVIPALGMAWSSMVTMRLMLSRTEQLIQPVNQALDGRVRKNIHVLGTLLREIFATR